MGLFSDEIRSRYNDTTAREFVSNGLDPEEQAKRRAAIQSHPELLQFGLFLTSERRLSPERLKQMASSANVYGEYELSIHDSLVGRENFRDWETLNGPETEQMEQSTANATMFRWILEGFYLQCKEHSVKLPHSLDIFKKGTCVHLQDIAEFIALLY